MLPRRFVVVIPLLAVLVLVACDEPVPENNSCDGAWFAQFLADETESTSDLSCVGDALVDTPFDPACQITAALAAQTVDHQSKDPVAGMSVTVHHSDDFAAAADWTATSDENG